MAIRKSRVTADNDLAGLDDLNDGGKKALVAERKARREAERKLKELQRQLDELLERYPHLNPRAKPRKPSADGGARSTW
jgi:hypothetical protein